MNFQYRADGLMSAVNNSTFGYGDNGLMTGRTNGSRVVSIDRRDGTGRPIKRTTRVNTLPVLNESWAWTEDGMPSQYVAGRSDFTDSRNFTYATLTRRLAQETLNLANNVSVTNAYTFDHGATGGMGVLTSAGQNGTLANSWNGGLDVFSRVLNGTNSLIHRVADGTVNGAAKLRGYVNGQPTDVRYDPHFNSRWTTEMALRPGTTNTLVVYADHPSGQFTTNKQATFTIAGNAYDKESSQYDGSGNVTNRVWKRADGQVVRTQNLTWDAFGRLCKITERDANGNGFNFVSVFDGLGRQIQTTETTVTNNVALAAHPAPITMTYHYDPQFEFLMIGVAVSQGTLSHQDWLAYGPDISGTYGGMQGIGGLETIVAPPFSVVIPVINDAFGNVLGAVTNGMVTWNSARVNLYAPVEGYAPPRPSVNVPLYASLVWRTRPINAAGLVQMGARPYDPIRRAFLSADPLGHESDPALNTAFNGNPAVYFDANGRLASQAWNSTVDRASTIYNNAVSTYNGLLNADTRGQTINDLMFGGNLGSFNWLVENAQGINNLLPGSGLAGYFNNQALDYISSQGNEGINNLGTLLGSNPNSPAAQTGNFTAQAGLTLASVLFAPEGGGGGGGSAAETRLTSTVGDLRAAGLRDAHHVVQDAAVRDLPGYNTQLAPGVQLPGPSTAVGTPHYIVTQVQRQAGGGTLAAEMRIGYKGLRQAGYSEAQARQIIAESDAYFRSIGATRSTPTRIPGNR